MFCILTARNSIFTLKISQSELHSGNFWYKL